MVGSHVEELEEILQENRLLGDVVEAGENLLDVGARAENAPVRKVKRAERNCSRQSPRQHHRIGSIIAARRDHVQSRPHKRTPDRKYLIFFVDIVGNFVDNV